MNKEKIIRTQYAKQFTRKEWKRFSLEKQEFLCKKYHVFLIRKEDEKILPARQTVREFLQQGRKNQAKQILKCVTLKNINNGITKTQKEIDKISKFARTFSFNKDLI